MDVVAQHARTRTRPGAGRTRPGASSHAMTAGKDHFPQRLRGGLLNGCVGAVGPGWRTLTGVSPVWLCRVGAPWPPGRGGRPGRFRSPPDGGGLRGPTSG
jgi:hypothetical protein